MHRELLIDWSMRARTTGWDGMVVTVVAVGKRGAVRRKAEHTSEPEHWFTITAIMRSGLRSFSSPALPCDIESRKGRQLLASW